MPPAHHLVGGVCGAEPVGRSALPGAGLAIRRSHGGSEPNTDRPAPSNPPKSHPTPTTAARLIVDGNVTGTGSGHFQYDVNWGLTTTGLPDMHQGTANWSHVAGATATFRFTGTQVALHTVRDFDKAS